jgi:uncharacterized membrane protein
MTGVFFEGVEFTIHLLEAIGVLVIVGGFVGATAFLRRDLRIQTAQECYVLYRRRSVQGLILGLEFLVAADIIKTITVDYSLDSVLMLGLIILMRSFLVVTLQLEIEGRLPWHRAGGTG